jgi:long-chain-acyl-CoA dehydrogenase
MRRDVFEPIHDEFRSVVKDYVDREVKPNQERWYESKTVDREAFLAASKAGLLGFNVPEEYGGGGIDDFRFNAIIGEELASQGTVTPTLILQNDIIAPYLNNLANEEQKARWMPGFASGELQGALAMTEPGAGSDVAGLRTMAKRDGSDWIVNGAKTFISSGSTADFLIVVARTDPDAGHRGFSLLVVERGMPGFARGKRIKKIGQHTSDVAELFFDDVRVPAENVLGELNRGFYHLMHNLPSERLSIAINAVAGARATLEQTLTYVKQRKAFGQPIGSFQHNKFVLASLDTELQIAQTFIDRCLKGVVEGELTAVEAAKAKWWTTELQKRVVDACVQLHGGYGYVVEYPVARAYVDARIQTIYGGSTEIMKEIIGKSLGL